MVLMVGLSRFAQAMQQYEHIHEHFVLAFARAPLFVSPPLSFPEPTICLVCGAIVRPWYQPLPDVVKFTTSGSACLIRQVAIAPALFSTVELWA